MRSRWRSATAGVLGAGLLALAGCSGDEQAPSAPTDSSPSVAESSTPSSAASSPTVDPYPPPYIESLSWVDTEVGPSLQIVPTANGRVAEADDAGDEAWSEVVALAADTATPADTPGMREQFDCHWTFARATEPDKPSWNIEPGRPEVTPEEMIASRCNPGFAEE